MTSEIVAKLSTRIRQLERSRVRATSDVSTSPAVEGLRRLLPEISSLRGGLIECLSDRNGAGSLSLAVLASQPAVSREELWVFIDSQCQWQEGQGPRAEGQGNEERSVAKPSALAPRPCQWHAAGLAALSLDLRRLVFVRCKRSTDSIWAAEQALRTRGVGAVVCEFDRLPTAAFRRLQLAAEEGGTLGILLRPERVRDQPSWAECRLLVRPLATVVGSGLPRRRLRVELLRARRTPVSAVKSVIVELDDADDRVYLVSELDTAAVAV